MPRIIWFTQLSNHSGYLNLLYLTPEGDVGRERTYTDLLTGYYIMGGPALTDEYDEITEAGEVLLSLLEKGFHFYPDTSEGRIRKQVQEKKDKVSENLESASQEFEDLWVCSKDLSDSDCLRILLEGQEPASPVALIHTEDGLSRFCEELARLYYHIPGDERKRLDLERDWEIPGD